MAIQSPSSSSSFSNLFKYQVFISFRGQDTRYDFAGNLYKALTNKGIHTFFDEYDLEGGDEITPSLFKAIEESRILIPVFSIHYASSSFCLKELAHIMKCYNTKNRLVIPIFYDVDPTDVRHQTGSYGNDLAKYDDNKEKMEWKEALRQAANLAGEHFIPSNPTYQYEFIDKIVKYISNKINRVLLHVAKHPVGLESRVQQVMMLLLDDGSGDWTHMVGLYGMGGLGKSTLAKAVYNFIAHQFDGSCYLENVRVNLDPKYLEHLQEKLLLKIIGNEIKVGSVSEGIILIKERLQRKKVLLILDNIDKIEQLDALAGELAWFGPGSRVIVTTRDKQLLTYHGIERTYAAEGLDKTEALELLRRIAFKNNEVPTCYEDILKRVVTYASGIPLVIEIVGSNLCGKSLEVWKDTLKGFDKRIPNEKIQEVLKVSYDALDKVQKGVFLDIVCCLKGFELEDVKEILHGRYDRPMRHVIQELDDKSLIKAHIYGVTCHDLIEDVGKEIVLLESKKLEERSRLWLLEDIIHVLEQDKENCDIEMIYLNCGSMEEIKDWKGNAFGKMRNLKAIIIDSDNISEGTIQFPCSLRVLQWKKYHSMSLPSTILSKKFKNMKVLKFDNCKYLTEISDVSCLPNLEILSFKNCENLVTIDDSVGSLSKLEFLNAYGCINLLSFPALNLASLKDLELSCCDRLQSFPEILCEIKDIPEINISLTSIKEFPPSFQKLTGLTDISIEWLLGEGMFGFPSFISEMPKLKRIHLERIDMLSIPNSSSTTLSNVEVLTLHYNNLSDECLPTIFLWCSNVKYLRLNSGSFKILPECLKECRHLRQLEVSFCKNLEEIRGIPPNLDILIAEYSKPLNSSSRSMLVNKKLHEHRKTKFCFKALGSEEIPEWFEYQSKGQNIISFWFRNKIPSLIIYLSTKLIRNIDATLHIFYHINGENSYRLKFHKERYNVTGIRGHTYIHHIDFKDYNKFENESEKAFLKNEWMHAQLELAIELEFESSEFLTDDYTYDEMHKLLGAKFGIHVLKEENNLEDIKFTNPYRKRKSDEYLSAMVFKYGRGHGFDYREDCCDDCSGCCSMQSCLGSMWAWKNYSPDCGCKPYYCRCKPYFKTMLCTLSQFHPLLKKQRILDIEVVETELRHTQRMGLLSLIPSGLERVASLLGHLKISTVSCSIGFLFLFACFFSCFAGFIIFFFFL